MFVDRSDAGQKLGALLQKFRGSNVIVLALPRGGVVVGFQVAKALEAALDVVIVRKIGAPDNPEFGIGAISESGVRILDRKTIKQRGYKQKEIEAVIQKELQEMRRRKTLYSTNRPKYSISKKTVILVDDGVATGVTAQAAIKSVLKKKPVHLVFATPVCAKESTMNLSQMVDEFICLISPEGLTAIGAYYEDFSQVSDKEVIEYLENTREIKQ